MTDLPAVPVSRFVAGNGTRIYRVTVPAFPHLKVHVFQVIQGPPEKPTYSAIVDTGSSDPASQQALRLGLEHVRQEFGENVNGQTLSRIVITHAHPDHAAALPAMRRFTQAPIAVHEHDVPVIERPEAFRDRNTAHIEEYLRWSDIQGSYAERLRKRAGNLLIPAGVPVQTLLRGGELLDGVFEVIHTPGHSSGQVCLRVDDLLLSADHILPLNSPPLMSQRFAPGGGLRRYLASLDPLEAMSGIRLALGSHDQEMVNWRGRIDHLRARYGQKLEATRQAAQEPRTLSEINAVLNPRMHDRQALLLLDQTAALIEYLLESGELTEQTGDGPSRFQRAAG